MTTDNDKIKGAIVLARKALEASIFFMKERDVLRDTRVNNEQALAKLDALIAEYKPYNPKIENTSEFWMRTSYLLTIAMEKDDE